MLVSGSADPRLAQAIAEELGEPLAPVDLTRHPDGEAAVAVDASVRGKDVYPTHPKGRGGRRPRGG